MTIRNVSGKRPALRKEKAVGIKLIGLKPIIIDVTAYLMLDLLISFLFFRSWLAALFLLPGMAVYLRQRQKQRRKKALLLSVVMIPTKNSRIFYCYILYIRCKIKVIYVMCTLLEHSTIPKSILPNYT